MSNTDKQINIEDLDGAPSSVPHGKLTAAEVDELYKRIRDAGEENMRLSDELSTSKQKLATKEKLDELIAPYADRAFKFLCYYCSGVLLVILLDGFQIFGFSQDGGVLEFLVGSTAVTVVGLVGMVLTGVFVGARK